MLFTMAGKECLFPLLLLFFVSVIHSHAEKVLKYDVQDDRSRNESNKLSSVVKSDNNLKRMKDILSGMEIDRLFASRRDVPERSKVSARASSLERKKDCPESLMKDATHSSHADIRHPEGMQYSSQTNYPIQKPYFDNGSPNNDFQKYNKNPSYANDQPLRGIHPKHGTLYSEDFPSERSLNPHINTRFMHDNPSSKQRSKQSFLPIGQSVNTAEPRQVGNSPFWSTHNNGNGESQFVKEKEFPKHVENHAPNSNLNGRYASGPVPTGNVQKQKIENLKKDFPFFNFKPLQQVEERQVYGAGVDKPLYPYQMKSRGQENGHAVHQHPEVNGRNFEHFSTRPQAIEGTKKFPPHDNFKHPQQTPHGAFNLMGSSMGSTPQTATKPAFRNAGAIMHDLQDTKPHFNPNFLYGSPKDNSGQSQEDSNNNYAKTASSEDQRIGVTPSNKGPFVSRSVSYSESTYGGKKGKESPRVIPNSEPYSGQKYPTPPEQPHRHHSEEDREVSPPPKALKPRETLVRQEFTMSHPKEKQNEFFSGMYRGPHHSPYGGPHSALFMGPHGGAHVDSHSESPNGFHSGPSSTPSLGLHSGPSSGLSSGSSGFHSGPPDGPSGFHKGPPSGPSGFLSGPPGGHSGFHSGPPSGPSGFHSGPSEFHNGPPGGSPGFHSGPPGGPSGFHSGPPGGPSGFHSGPSSNLEFHGGNPSGPSSGFHSRPLGGPNKEPYSGPHSGPYGSSHDGPHSGEPPNYSSPNGYGDSQYQPGSPEDSHYQNPPVVIDRDFFSKYGVSNKAKIIVAEQSPGKDGLFVADGTKAVKPGDPAHPAPSEEEDESYRNSHHMKNGRHTRYRRPQRTRARHSKHGRKHRDRMYKESSTQINEQYSEEPMIYNDQSEEQSYHSGEFKPQLQQTKELVQNHGNGISRVVYSVPTPQKLSKLF